MVAPVIRCSTQDHMPGSPRYRGRRRAGFFRGVAISVSVLIGPPTSGRGDSKPLSSSQSTTVLAVRRCLTLNLGLPTSRVGPRNEVFEWIQNPAGGADMATDV